MRASCKSNVPSMAVAHAELLACLEAAMSPIDAARKPAEAQLKANEHVPGFCDALLAVLSPEQLGAVPPAARLMAVICLKNVQRRHWSARGNRTLRVLTDEEKARVRSALLAPAAMAEASAPVAEQFAVLVAKVARTDWPQAWPELFPSLLQSMSTAHATASSAVAAAGSGAQRSSHRATP